ncbi:MAG: efflux RND transporter periplasmic adaptor subunit [Isosphaeraceae bacterium]|nr:efflux RND transporter periplasmic adaptor subunit [Isosphaeraceae bacterium]
MTRPWWLALGPLLAGILAGCQPPAAPAAPSKSAAPAKVESAVKESELATVKLTAEAEKRLGVVTVPAERKKVPRTTSYGGEVMVPVGRLVSVASPFNGQLKAPQGRAIPVPGAKVKAGQPIFVLEPILSPESRATLVPLMTEAEGQVRQTTQQLKARKIELDRAEGLVRNKIGSSAALEDARGQYDLAQTALRAAEQRLEILQKVAGNSEGGKLTEQTIEAPADGLLNNVHAQTGQMIAANTILFDVVTLNPVWVKVPVYVGDLTRIDAGKPAGIGGLAEAPGVATKPGRPVAAPPTGDPLAATVHLYYEVENKDESLRPGQRVGVTLPLKGENEELAVPRASLLRDIHGGVWVYENTAPHTYVRRRVVVDRVVGELAALAGGALKPGAKVVTDGAAEIFGTEFGGGK